MQVEVTCAKRGTFAVPLELTTGQRDAIVAHAQSEAPLECCGLIGGTDGRARKVYPTRNVDRSRVHYTIHPEDMLHAIREIEFENDWETLAIYHSHPASDAYPSPTDIRIAVESGYNEVTRFVIVSLAQPELPVVRAFWLKGGKVEREPIEVVDDASA